MGIISRTGDLFYAFRFLKLLVTPWNKMPAYDLGIIDDNGKVLKKKRTTPEEKSAYTVFHRLVFNLKRLLGKIPFGKTRLATYASALFLIKESSGMDEETIREVLDDIFNDLESIDLSENNVNHRLTPGTYFLQNDIASIDTGEIIGHINNKVKVNDFVEPYGSIFGLNVYQVEHVITKQKLLVTSADIKK
jgi:hypothetical protein